MSDRRPAVVLTRRREDSEGLARELAAAGVDVLVLPCLRVEPLEDTQALASALAAIGRSDLLVLTSRFGADAVAPFRPGAPVAAIGPATAERARALGLAVAFVASRADGVTLARELPLPEGEVVLARSDLADGEPVRILRARGARARDVVAYRTVPAIDGDVAALTRAIADGPVAVLVASPSAVAALVQAVEPGTLRRAAFVAIGRRTARAVRERLGIEADIATGGDLAGALIAAASRREALVT